MLNPLILFNSAVWGQMDGVLALLTVLMLYAYLQEKKPLCAVFFVLGVLVKPQMLMFGPIMLVAFLRDVVHRPEQELLATLYSILAGAATLVLVALPFTLKQNPLWLWEKYAGAAGLYPYATVNAFNLYALVGANWAPDTGIFFLGLSYRTLGIACIALICILAGVFHVSVSYTHLGAHELKYPVWYCGIGERMEDMEAGLLYTSSLAAALLGQNTAV